MCVASNILKKDVRLTEEDGKTTIHIVRLACVSSILFHLMLISYCIVFINAKSTTLERIVPYILYSVILNIMHYLDNLQSE